uniref:Uncharacterized protein n=1 Tax=Mucochytrium quahogii TaxID=96639 RepID=A0A7S2SLC7_9STRA|mmetsp:Transcript_6461/g.11191  ORF Transcript_6461/g.11191 Transcript_6461/m.11191 type:complete len:104 (-) Transcript_6461:634-945(-)
MRVIICCIQHQRVLRGEFGRKLVNAVHVLCLGGSLNQYTCHKSQSGHDTGLCAICYYDPNFIPFRDDSCKLLYRMLCEANHIESQTNCSKQQESYKECTCSFT